MVTANKKLTEWAFYLGRIAIVVSQPSQQPSLLKNGDLRLTFQDVAFNTFKQ